MKTKKVLILFGGLLLSACSPTSDGTPTGVPVVQKGARLIGMDANNPSSDFTFAQSYTAAQSIGVSAGTSHINWNGDEAAGSAATSGAFTDTGAQLASINAYYPAVSSKASLTIAPIDTPGPALPSDLAGATMDNANVITRFNHFIDWVFTQIPATTLTSIQIGNEIDIPGGASTALYWSQYRTFLSAVVAHIHSLKPGVKVGVTVTLYGLIGQGSNAAVAKTGIQNLLSAIDILGLTYYPLDASFNVKDPSVVAGDFTQAIAAAGGVPIYFQEVGYPSSSLNASSDAKQASFIAQVFGAWDAHASQISFLAFLRVNDLSLIGATSLAANYGLSGNATFVAYLQTLGIRTYSSPTSYKAGWTQLQTETHARGWW